MKVDKRYVFDGKTREGANVFSWQAKVNSFLSLGLAVTIGSTLKRVREKAAEIIKIKGT